MDPEVLQDLRDRLSDIDSLTDEELAQLETDLAAAGEAFDPEAATDEDIAAITELGDGADRVREAITARETAATERREQAEAARLRLVGETTEEDAAGDGDDAPADGEGEGDAATTDGEPATPEDGEAAEPAAEQTPEQIAAAAAPAPRARPSIPAVARRVPADRRPRARAGADTIRRTVTAAANVPGLNIGAHIPDDVVLARAIVDVAHGLRGQADTRRYLVASVNSEYPEERQLLGDGPSNTARMDALLSPQALTASGGLCAPLTPLYDVPQISDDQRVVPGALTRFQADRGGMRWVPPPRLGQFDAGVSVWTVANDENPSSPSTKPCVRVTCDPEETEVIEAIPMCLTVGNFYAMTYDERVQAILALLRSTAARFSESRLLTKIGAGSTQVSTTQQLGATRDFLAKTGLAVAAFRNRHRMMSGVRLRLLLPDWIHQLLLADLARQMPGDDELGTAASEIDAWIRNLGVEPTFFVDGEAGQIFGSQGDGPLEGWPTEAIGYLFHEGAWVYLDGGRLDLGVVRDSTLNATNDLQIWSENFENVAFRGIESLRIAYDLCPDGSSVGTVEPPEICSTGS